MRLALDTNRYTDFSRGATEALEVLEGAASVFVPLIVVAELRAGFALGARENKNESVLRKFLRRAGVEVLIPSLATTAVYARLYRQLRARGTPIPTNDLWIAALVVEHELALYSRDRHFRYLPEIELI